MTVTLTLKKLEKEDWFKVVKVFLYAAISLGLAAIPALLAHNPAYVALSAPINAILVGLRQTVKQEEQVALSELPANQQTPVETTVNAVEQAVNPSASTETSTPAAQ